MKAADEAERELARARAAHTAASESLRDATEALERVQRELEEAPDMDRARLVENAEREKRAAELLVSSQAAAVRKAEEKLAAARRADARGALEAIGVERSRLRLELHALLGTFRRLYEGLDQAAAAAGQLLDVDARLAKRAEALAVEADAILDEDALDPTIVRLAIGASLAEAFGTPSPPPPAAGSAEFTKALRSLAGFVGTSDELDARLEELAQEWTHCADPRITDWLRLVPEPRWDTHSEHARRTRRAYQLLDQLKREAEAPLAQPEETPCPPPETISTSSSWTPQPAAPGAAS